MLSIKNSMSATYNLNPKLCILDLGLVKGQLGKTEPIIDKAKIEISERFYIADYPTSLQFLLEWEI